MQVIYSKFKIYIPYNFNNLISENITFHKKIGDFEPFDKTSKRHSA